MACETRRSGIRFVGKCCPYVLQLINSGLALHELRARLEQQKGSLCERGYVPGWAKVAPRRFR